MDLLRTTSDREVYPIIAHLRKILASNELDKDIQELLMENERLFPKLLKYLAEFNCDLQILKEISWTLINLFTLSNEFLVFIEEEYDCLKFMAICL
jgi:hypothetical protein